MGGHYKARKEDTKRCQVSLFLKPVGHLPFAGSHWLSLVISPYGSGWSLTGSYNPTPTISKPQNSSGSVPKNTNKNLKRQHKRNQAFYNNNNRQKSFSSHYLDFPGFDFSTTKESFIILHPHPKRTTVYSRRKSRFVP